MFTFSVGDTTQMAYNQYRASQIEMVTPNTILTAILRENFEISSWRHWRRDNYLKLTATCERLIKFRRLKIKITDVMVMATQDLAPQYEDIYIKICLTFISESEQVAL